MGLSLATDRSQADVDLIKTLSAKDWQLFTAEEKDLWLYGELVPLTCLDGPITCLDGPIMCRKGSMRGAYNFIDINRISTAINYLASLLTSYGYYITSSLKDTWLATDTPISPEIEAVLEKADELKAFFYGTTNLPSTMNNLTYEDANNIEKLLLEIDTNISWMITGFRKSGTFKSGQGVKLP